MGFSLDISVPAVTVFLQGLLSFFSPCVLPLIPLYIGYLSGGTAVIQEDGKVVYKKSKVMFHTLFFVIGISFAFFLLGIGMSALGSFFQNYQMLFVRIGGIIITVFGLYQFGVFGTSDVLGTEKRLPLKLDPLAMSPVTALVMGFTFSFAWTPCVGPTLASVLLLTASAKTKGYGLLLMGIYTLGFVLPFLAVGLFTTSLLQFFKKHGQVVKYTVKIGGALMVFIGVLMFTGKMNGISGYLSEVSLLEETLVEEEDTVESVEDSKTAEVAETAENAVEENEEIPALDFTLTDQFGNVHSLEDYKGKTIFLNFWATWCPPCKAEMPDIQAIYESYDQEGEDALIVLGVAAPNLGKETSKEGIIQFLEENDYTYPTLMDEEYQLFGGYGITSYPTTFMIDRDGNLFGYVSGQISEEIMHSIIKQTLTGIR